MKITLIGNIKYIKRGAIVENLYIYNPLRFRNNQKGKTEVWLVIQNTADTLSEEYIVSI